MRTTKKIKILQGIRQGKIGGGENYLLGLVENLDKERFEPVVLSFTDGPMIDKMKSMGVSTHVIHTEKPFDIKVWKKVAALLQEEGVDLVHAHGTRAMSNMFRPAKQAKLPLIYTCHGWSFHPDQNPVVNRLRILSEKYLTSKASLNICGGKANRDLAHKLFGRFDAEVIYNSIDHAKFNPYGNYEDIRKELGIAHDEIIIASIARFTLQKQPLALIEAFAQASHIIPNARLLMVGDGELKSQSEALVEKLALQDRILMQPFRQDVPDLLAAADIFALPSLWEGFPLALLEAMSMGKTVIATNVDGNPEMIQDGYNGLLIDSQNLHQELAQGLVRLCQDDVLRRTLSANAIASIYNQYNVSTLVQKNEAVYERLMAGRIKNKTQLVAV